MVICLEQGADLHMSQLLPLPLTVSCFSKIQIGFTFLVLAHLGSPEKGPSHQDCWCPHIHHPPILCRMLFLPQRCQFSWLGIGTKWCWLAYPLAWLYSVPPSPQDRIQPYFHIRPRPDLGTGYEAGFEHIAWLFSLTVYSVLTIQFLFRFRHFAPFIS